MDLHIRTAKKDDCTGITELSNQLGYPSSFDKVYEILDLVLNHDDHQVYIVEADDLIVGYIHLVSTMRISSDPFVEIAALIVHKSYQNKGVGKSLINESEKWTRSKGLSDIRIRSNIIREEAHKYFQRKGFQDLKTQHVFLKQLNSSIK
jgi:N-acetylglutamate synthase-like GNAT family acetyltransferase